MLSEYKKVPYLREYHLQSKESKRSANHGNVGLNTKRRCSTGELGWRGGTETSSASWQHRRPQGRANRVWCTSSSRCGGSWGGRGCNTRNETDGCGGCGTRGGNLGGEVDSRDGKGSGAIRDGGDRVACWRCGCRRRGRVCGRCCSRASRDTNSGRSSG
jgi:hypothetical protein